MRTINREKLINNIESRIDSDLREGNVDGVSLLVAQGRKTVFCANFGKARNDSLFRIASMTKPITAVAILILVERGLISLDDPIDLYIPSFSSPFILNDKGEKLAVSEKITARQLLTHTSGVASGTVWEDYCRQLTEKEYGDHSAFVDFLSDKPLSFVPGKKNEYSGVGGFSLLAELIIKICGCSLEDFFVNEIFEPCHMKNTTFSPSPEQWERVIPMHDKKYGKSKQSKTHEGCVFERFSVNNQLGGAGLISNIEDYSRFAEMLLNRGIYDGRRILSEETVRTMSSPQIAQSLCSSPYKCWGLGVKTVTSHDYGTLPIGSFGWSGAYGTHFWVDPINRICAIYMKNSRYDGGSGALTASNFEADVYEAVSN